MATFLERYLRGDRSSVWHELRQLGLAARFDDRRADVEAVVREAMQRCRRNVETLIARLAQEKFRFFANEAAEAATVPHAPPDAQTQSFVAWLESRFSPIPLTARMWIEIVGDVDLNGIHPFWPERVVTDPLVVEFECKSWRRIRTDRTSTREHLESEHDAWRERHQNDDGDVGPFDFDVAPDALTKANISGGDPYSVLLPDGCVDASFRGNDRVVVPFIEYLRHAFRWGGFPGIARYEDPSARMFWRGLGRGLEPI